MIDNKKKNMGGINTVAAAVTGAIVGGVAVAGAMVLKDEKNREKIKKTVNDVKNQSMDYVEGIRDEMDDKKDEVEEKLNLSKDSLAESANAAKKEVKNIWHK
jgi:hypothetical protein